MSCTHYVGIFLTLSRLHVDLHGFYTRYCNLPKIHSDKGDLEYLSYLDKFNSFFQIPEG